MESSQAEASAVQAAGSNLRRHAHLSGRQTPAQSADWYVRLFPSLTDLAFLFPLYFLFAKIGGVRYLLRDADTGLQIRAGEWMLQNHGVPRVDIFSFSKAGQPWFAWEWGWDVLSALLHQRFGLAGFALANCCILALTAVVIFRLARRRSGHPLLAFTITALAVQASCVHWLARPHLLSWLLFSVLLLVLDRIQAGSRHWLWALPPLSLLWANLHASFFLVALLSLAYAAGDLLSGLFLGVGTLRSGYLRRAGRYAVAAVASLSVSLLNPYGVELHQHVAKYLLDSRQLDVIREFQAFDFRHMPAVQIEILLLTGSAAACWSFYRRRWADTFILLLWLHLALHSTRNIPLFAFAVAGPASLMIRELLSLGCRSRTARGLMAGARAVLFFGREFSSLEQVERFCLPSVAAVAMIALLLGARAPDAFDARFDNRVFPVGALTAQGPASARHLLTADQWGSYLIYAGYPNAKVFLDDRSDFYGAEFDSQAVRLFSAQYDWEKTLTRYQIDAALISPSDPLATVMKLSAAWCVSYDDGIAVFFSRRLSAGQGAPGCPLLKPSVGLEIGRRHAQRSIGVSKVNR
ncbi:MAG: hypothetical protein WBW33_05160 [Bryobacteraceae bacterium]